MMANGSAKGAVAIGVTVLAVISALWVLRPLQPDAPEPEAAAAEAPATAPEAAQTATPEATAAAPAPDATAPEAAAPVPRLDVVRVDEGGLATIAGTAAPGAMISLRLDGVELSQIAADASGQFATLLTLSPSETPRLLSLVQISPDGTEIAGPDSLALAPVKAPEVTAEAAAETTPETAPETAGLLVSPEGVSVVESASASAAPSLPISIETIAYGAAGEVNLSGKAGLGAKLRIYLDEAPIAEVMADDTGKWSAVLADVAAGVHVLRVDEVDAAGGFEEVGEVGGDADADEGDAVVGLGGEQIAQEGDGVGGVGVGFEVVRVVAGLDGFEVTAFAVLGLGVAGDADGEIGAK